MDILRRIIAKIFEASSPEFDPAFSTPSFQLSGANFILLGSAALLNLLDFEYE